MKEDYKLVFPEDEDRAWRRFWFILIALAVIITIFIISQIKPNYEYSKVEEIARVKGNINSCKVTYYDGRYSRYELDVKLKEYKCTFYFDNNDFDESVWNDIRNETGKNKDCKIGIWIEDKNSLQEDKYVEIQELKIEGREYISWQDRKEEYHMSFYVCIVFAVVGLGVCIFFIYAAMTKGEEL